VKSLNGKVHRNRKSVPGARGSRLPPDWQPSNGDAEFARKPWRAQMRIRADKFRDYYSEAPGLRGVSADWSATWRN
jgi:hypothetical protein